MQLEKKILLFHVILVKTLLFLHNKKNLKLTLLKKNSKMDGVEINCLM